MNENNVSQADEFVSGRAGSEIAFGDESPRTSDTKRAFTRSVTDDDIVSVAFELKNADVRERTKFIRSQLFGRIHLAGLLSRGQLFRRQRLNLSAAALIHVGAKKRGVRAIRQNCSDGHTSRQPWRVLS